MIVRDQILTHIYSFKIHTNIVNLLTNYNTLNSSQKRERAKKIKLVS